eukprot:1194986-Prorocentrum_minimum.AAC.2
MTSSCPPLEGCPDDFERSSSFSRFSDSICTVCSLTCKNRNKWKGQSLFGVQIDLWNRRRKCYVDARVSVTSWERGEDFSPRQQGRLAVL